MSIDPEPESGKSVKPNKALTALCSFGRALLSEKVGTGAAVIALLALLFQLADYYSRENRDADMRTATEAATRVWFEDEGGWTLMLAVLEGGDSVMAPRELEITPVVSFPETQIPPALGSPLIVEVTEFSDSQDDERYRVVVENVRDRVCNARSGNAELCSQGKVQRFLVKVNYGKNESFKKRAFLRGQS